MKTRKIVWKDLEKRTGLFTTRNTAMVSLDDGTPIQYFSANTKLNVVQEATVDGVKYFRTESAARKGLNWAIKASSFSLPNEVASLEPSRKSFSNDKPYSTYSKTPSHKKISKTPKASESEEKVSEERRENLISAFKRFLRRKK